VSQEAKAGEVGARESGLSPEPQKPTGGIDTIRELREKVNDLWSLASVLEAYLAEANNRLKRKPYFLGGAISLTNSILQKARELQDIVLFRLSTMR
jgi:hypothetical protein